MSEIKRTLGWQPTNLDLQQQIDEINFAIEELQSSNKLLKRTASQLQDSVIKILTDELERQSKIKQKEEG